MVEDVCGCISFAVPKVECEKDGVEGEAQSSLQNRASAVQVYSAREVDGTLEQFRNGD